MPPPHVPPGSFRRPAAAPHEPVRTYHARRSPLGPARLEALATLWPVLGFSVDDDGDHPAPLTPGGLLDTVTLFGRRAPLVLEIGSGMGETVAAMAASDPTRDYLAVEVHLPGIAHLLTLLEQRRLTNVRVAHGDAMDLIRRRIAPAALDAVHVFFPDPWPKTRHAKRRIVQPIHVAALVSRLVPGGTLHCATDWAPYAAEMLETLTADPGLANEHVGYAPRPPHRPVTKFEQRGLGLGHEIADLVFRRVTDAPIRPPPGEIAP